MEQAKAHRNILKSFYSVLKDASKMIRLLFITGVSKFAKVSIFSDLNHLSDLTIHPDYTTLTGYTQEELEFYFEDHIQIVQNKLKISRADLLEAMRVWYDGFSWDGVNKLYNPFGTINFLDHKRFHNFWFSSGTPTFLLQEMKKHHHFIVENSAISSDTLEKYDIENVDLIPLLFQTGYLTIKNLDPMTGDTVLDYPNKEVRESMH